MSQFALFFVKVTCASLMLSPTQPRAAERHVEAIGFWVFVQRRTITIQTAPGCAHSSSSPPSPPSSAAAAAAIAFALISKSSAPIATLAAATFFLGFAADEVLLSAMAPGGNSRSRRASGRAKERVRRRQAGKPIGKRACTFKLSDQAISPPSSNQATGIRQAIH